jgi:DNA gyrase inhibitor GyrI
MGDHTATLSVSIRELSPVHVAYVSYKANVGQDDLYNQIHECFQRVQTWVSDLGYDPFTQLTIGALKMVDGQLSSYECCVQVPEQVQSGSGGVDVQELPGGRYAIVTIDKDPKIIGGSIGRFYQEYVPQNHIEIDGARPTYEIYYETTMEYCVPIIGGRKENEDE